MRQKASNFKQNKHIHSFPLEHFGEDLLLIAKTYDVITTVSKLARNCHPKTLHIIVGSFEEQL